MLAAVGSFVVSERVLKPKATVLVILGCVLAYDLTTKTRDPSSLRVYRGKTHPSLEKYYVNVMKEELKKKSRSNQKIQHIVDSFFCIVLLLLVVVVVLY